MANQCEGCVHQQISPVPHFEDISRRHCANCRPTYKGPSLYWSKIKTKGESPYDEKKVEQL